MVTPSDAERELLTERARDHVAYLISYGGELDPAHCSLCLWLCEQPLAFLLELVAGRT